MFKSQKFLSLVLTICFCFVNIIFAYAEESVSVIVEKEGQLSKHIKKNDIPNIKALTVSGAINNVDLKLIASLPNLECLNLADAVLSKNKYDSEKLDYYDGRSLRISEFSNLKKLIGPKDNCDIKGLQTLTNLKVLYVYGGWSLKFRDLKEKGFVNSLDTLGFLRAGKAREESPKNAIDHYYNPSYLSRPIRTKVLYSEILMGGEQLDDIMPDVIKTPSKIMLYHWSPSLTEQDLETVDILLPYSYLDASVSKITIPSKVKVLPSNLVGKNRDENLQHITEIDLANIEDIEKQALNGCFIDKLILPSTLKYFHKEAFDKGWIDEAYFTSNSAPIMYDKKYRDGDFQPASYMGYNTMTKFVVPAGKMDRFRIGPWAYSNSHGNYTCLFEDGINSDFSFDIEKPGTLSDFITDEIAPYIENLTLSGVLYDTDFEVIKKCKNLRTLNLAETLPCLSPETLAQKQMTAEALAGFFGLALEGAAQNSKSKFINGNGSFNEAAYYQALNENYKKMVNSGKNDPIDSDIKCQLPEKAFDGLHFLKKIVYPKILKDIKNGRISSPNIQEVILPPNLIELNAHIGGPRLISINIPASVKKIGFGVFYGCENLYEVDLRNTNVETIAADAFMNCPNIKNFYGSPFLKSIKGIGDHWDKIETGWFYTKEMPDGLQHHCKFKTIHIPEGYTAAYSLYGTKIIDDIIN